MNYTREIQRFEQHMIAEEKSAATIEKYLRDIRGFCSHLAGRRISKEETIAYKEYLTAEYSPASVNSMLAAINSFFEYLGCEEYKVKLFKIQRVQFSEKEKELTEKDYERSTPIWSVPPGRQAAPVWRWCWRRSAPPVSG